MVRYLLSLIQAYSRGGRDPTAMTRPTQEDRASIHEGAHSVMACELGFELFETNIIEEGDTAGCTRHRNPFHNVDLETIDHDDPDYGKHFSAAIDNLVVELAGDMAEQKYLNIKETGGSDDDRNKAIDFLKRFVPNEKPLKALYDYVVAQTDDFLNNPRIREEIHRVADALMQHRRLSGEEVKDVIATTASNEVKKWEKTR